MPNNFQQALLFISDSPVKKDMGCYENYFV